MGAPLPRLSFERFSRRLASALSQPVDEEVLRSLFLHYEELRRWNPRLSLIGPGTVDQAVERHFAESLEARELLRAEDHIVTDLGSGAGFPGLPLAAAVPALEVWLVEPQSRKWAFLRSVSAAAGIRCHCLDERVNASVPATIPTGIDVLTVRALKLDVAAWSMLATRLSPSGRALVWSSAEKPAGLAGWTKVDTLRLAGRDRWILAFEPPR